MLNDFGIVEENVSLENYNTYRIKTTSKYLAKPTNIASLQSLLIYLEKNKIPYLILGKGSNVILPDNPFNGCIISLEKINQITIEENKVTVECGAILGVLVKKLIDNNLQGLEHLALIPGSVGGALFGNAGVKNHSIYDYLISVEVLRNNELITIKKEEIKIDYRQTSFQNSQDILVKAVFVLTPGNKEELQQVVADNRAMRTKTQPLEYSNAGSVFRNPEGYAAGKLIDDLNLKGYHINDAYISDKHANFIINKDSATSKDIKELIKYIQKKVQEHYKIELVLEQRIIEWE